MLCIGAYGRSFVLEAPYNTGGNKQSKNLTDFSNHKHIDSPYNTIAATNCEGDPPLEIDTTVPAKRRKAVLQQSGTGSEKGEKPCPTEITTRSMYPKQRKP